MTASDYQRITAIRKKKPAEMTDEELKELVEFDANVIARDKYLTELDKERQKTQAIRQAYYDQLAADSQAAFDARCAKILAECGD